MGTQFSDLGLSSVLTQTLEKLNYQTPSPIQAKAIPAILEGRDVMAAAQTGTGKTAGFTLPILERLSTGDNAKSKKVRALILTPTRELADQVARSVSKYGKNLSLRTHVVFGGVRILAQIRDLRSGSDILVATPGRLLDLYEQKAVQFDQVETFVLDEADRMLDMGFLPDIKRISELMPKQKQTLLFSATFSTAIKKLAQGVISNPVEILISTPNSTAHNVKQLVHPVDKRRKPELLAHLIRENQWEQVLVFARTKMGCNRLAGFLNDHRVRAIAIHGDKSQYERNKALSQFKKGKASVLVATNVAARGIDIDRLPHVINMDLPQEAEDYIHRIGRTGRAGAKGEALSLVSADEINLLCQIERLIQKTLPREIIEGFEPLHELPTAPVRGASSKKRRRPSPHRGRANNSQNTSRRNRFNPKQDTRGENKRGSSHGSRDNSQKKSSEKTHARSKPSQQRQGKNTRRNDQTSSKNK